MDTLQIRVLVVDDYEPWRRLACSMMQKLPQLQVVGNVADGLEAVQQAEKLQPDLILLDIGLPSLNGIEAARRIQRVSPASKILFVSENRSADIAEEALNTGAGGYVLKSDAENELLPAVDAVLAGKRFTSASLAGHGLNCQPKPQTGGRFQHQNLAAPLPAENTRSAGHHGVGFYSDDRHLLDNVAQFIGAALKTGNSAIVVATESHRQNLLSQLQAAGVDVGGVIDEGRYIPLDAGDALSMFMVNSVLDPVRLLEHCGDLIVTAREAAQGANQRVSIFGECADLLAAQGKAEAVIQIEKLANKLMQMHDVDIFCGYSLATIGGAMDSHIFEQICAEHSAVYWL